MRRDEIWQDRLDRDIKAYHRGEISESVLRAALKSAGFYGVRLEEEFRYQDCLRIAGTYSQ